MHSLFWSRDRSGVAAACAALAVLLSACSSSAGGSTALQAVPKGPPGAPSSQTYSFTTVDDSAGTDNRVTGINDNSEIVGVYYSSSSSQIYNSYVSQPYNGQYTNFSITDWPDAHARTSSGGTYISSIATTVTYTQPIAAGYTYNPGGTPGSGGGSEAGVWAIADNQGLWTMLRPHTGQHPQGCRTQQLLGINASGYSVGEYGDPTNSCLPQAFEELPGATGINLSPTSPASYLSVATGINDGNDVVGWLQATRSNASTKGWYAVPDGSGSCKSKPYCYAVLTYKNTGDSTQLLNLNKTSVAVGSYTVGSVTHGLIVTSPLSNPVWQSVDESNAKGITVVSGINDSGDICGWYNDSNGNFHGFVGTPSGSAKLHKPRAR